MKKNVNIVYMSEDVPLEEVQTGEMGAETDKMGAETVEYTGKFEEVPLGKMGEVPLGKMGEVPLGKMGEVPLDKMGEPYTQAYDEIDIRLPLVVEDKGYWNGLLEEQKIKGNPVLYGEPTPEIVEILIRLYHANLLRVAYLSNYENEDVDYSNEKGPYQFMTGLAMHNGTIYMTISEDPQEDALYFQKIRTLIQMLKFCKININYEEYGGDDAVAIDIHNNMTKGSDKKKLYPAEHYGNTATFKGIDTVGKYGLTMASWKQLKLAGRCYLEEQESDKNTIVPFDPRLFENELSVTLVNSYDYLQKRRDGVGYYPFRRRDEGHPGKYSCNNGSTCVESKLFSYLRDKQGLQDLGEIQGETAYWIGNKLPPNHILTKYSYCDRVNVPEFCFETDSGKLSKLVRVFLGKLGSIRGVVATNPEIFREIVRPFALPCPGCLKNWLNYNGNKRTAFDYNQCIVTTMGSKRGPVKRTEPVGPDYRGDETLTPKPPSRKGGSRTRARRTRTRKTKMRQTRTRKTRNGTVKRRRNKYSHARLTR